MKRKPELPFVRRGLRLLAGLLALLLVCLWLPGAVFAADASPAESSEDLAQADSTEAADDTPEDVPQGSGLPGWLLWVVLGASVLIVGLLVLILNRRQKQED